MSRGAFGSAAKLRRLSAMAALSASLKVRSTGRTPSRVSWGTKSGSPIMSNGSRPPHVAYRKSAIERRVLASRMPNGLVTVDGEQWQRLRRTLAPIFGRPLVLPRRSS